MGRTQVNVAIAKTAIVTLAGESIEFFEFLKVSKSLVVRALMAINHLNRTPL